MCLSKHRNPPETTKGSTLTPRHRGTVNKWKNEWLNAQVWTDWYFYSYNNAELSSPYCLCVDIQRQQVNPCLFLPLPCYVFKQTRTSHQPCLSTAQISVRPSLSECGHGGSIKEGKNCLVFNLLDTTVRLVWWLTLYRALLIHTVYNAWLRIFTHEASLTQTRQAGIHEHVCIINLCTLIRREHTQ